MSVLSPPPANPHRSDDLEALIKEARERQFRRRLLLSAVALAVAAGTALAISAVVSGGGRTAAIRQGNGANAPAALDNSPCGVRVAGARIVSGSGSVVYREPGTWTHPAGQVVCSGATVWAVFDNGAASNQEGYVGAVSANHGRTWRLVFAEGYFGVNAPHMLDSYLGPFKLRGPHVAYFSGWCPACSPKPTVSLWVTKNLGRSFQRYPIRALAGYEPIRMRMAGGRITFWAVRMIRGEAPKKTVTITAP